jgi:hypothetical protein
MAKSKPVQDKHVWFVVAKANDEPDISLKELWDIHRNHEDLPDDEAAGNILKAIDLGYLAAKVTLTPAGKKFLGETHRQP